jgi:hypothetical protein
MMLAHFDYCLLTTTTTTRFATPLFALPATFSSVPFTRPTPNFFSLTL